jgi:dipeptidase D
MKADLEQMEPQTLWSFFWEICQIPRASGKTQTLQDWLLYFAHVHKLEAKRDAVGNILILKPASLGKEQNEVVVLQSHMDMVCEKNSESSHNFDTDPIVPWIDGEWMKARGTTLGADNGIGMAAQLAILASDTLVHGPLECLFTVDEETGLTGAFGLDANILKGLKLINLDSEEDGEVFIGCAGGMNSKFSFRFNTETAPSDYFFFKATVRGLTGGHSGDDIEKGRGNANHLLARFLWDEKAHTDIRLCSFSGGNLSNAIPREAVCIAAVPWSEKESVRIRLNCLQADLEEEFGAVEPTLELLLESVSMPEPVLLKVDSDRFINVMYGCPIGVQAMSHAIEGLVDTSLNLASVKPVDVLEWVITTSQRSSYESAKKALSCRLEAIFTLAGMTVWHGEGYPGWAPNPNSSLLKVIEASHTDLFASSPKVKAIHAGLECGLFLEKYPAMDMVSIGPTMRGVHSPDERVYIPAVDNFWKWLLKSLETI